MNRTVDQPSFLGEFLELFVGSWKNQVIVYLLIFALGSLVGLVGAFNYHLAPQKLAQLVVGFTALMVFVVPGIYVFIQRIYAHKTVQSSKPKADTFVKRVYYLPATTETSSKHEVFQILTPESRERFGTSQHFISFGPESYDKDLVFGYLTQELEEVARHVTRASSDLNRYKRLELKKNLDKSFGFVIWFVAYAFWKKQDAPDVSWDDAVKTYVNALEESRK